MTLASFLVTFFTSLFTGGTLVAALQLVVNRRGRRAEAAKLEAEREKTLADAQALAQRTALDSAATAYGNLERQCARCNAELEKATGALEAVIFVGENAAKILKRLIHDDPRILSDEEHELTADLDAALVAARRAL